MNYAFRPPGVVRPSGTLIIAGQPHHIDAPVVNWTEAPHWDATLQVCVKTITDPDPFSRCTVVTSKTGGYAHVPYGVLPNGAYTQRYAIRPALASYGGRMPPYEAVKACIKKFVIHHDGCSSADMCFSVLQNERGLSVHFLLDNDGIIYQTIDLALMAYHASEWNVDSIGVEMCSRGDVKRNPNYYASGRYGPDHPIIPCRINGNTILSYDYTKEQYDSMVALCRALTHLLPNIPTEFPQASPGIQSWDTMQYGKTLSYAGYIGHYHLTQSKWDPGAFDFKDFCRRVRGAYCFPVFAKDDPKRTPDAKPTVPAQADDLKEAAKDLFKTNEVMGDGGFFPVGPWGESRLWHGGIHLVGKTGDGVFAPFPGRLVAARMGATSPIGSVNFVLVRHDMALGGTARVQFYSLYMHLADELAEATKVEWITKDAWKATGKAGAVVLLDEAIEAGQMIGRVGKVGPGDASRAQIHVELFSPAELTALPDPPWKVIDGTSGGRFCDVKEIDELIDTNHDGSLSKQELASFYNGGAGAGVRYLVTQHVSEWIAEPSWTEALRAEHKEYSKMKPAELDEMVANQITPGLWWDAATAAHCKLPPDGVVFHYNPVAFISWVNQQMLDAESAADKVKIDPTTASKVPDNITDDLGDVTGKSMRSTTTATVDTCNDNLGLQDLVQGFDTPECVK